VLSVAVDFRLVTLESVGELGPDSREMARERLCDSEDRLLSVFPAASFTGCR